jgi:hypothetical protein
LAFISFQWTYLLPFPDFFAIVGGYEISESAEERTFADLEKYHFAPSERTSSLSGLKTHVVWGFDYYLSLSSITNLIKYIFLSALQLDFNYLKIINFVQKKKPFEIHFMIIMIIIL